MRKRDRHHSRALFVALAVSIAGALGAWLVVHARHDDEAAPARIAIAELRSLAGALALVAQAWDRNEATMTYARSQAHQLAQPLADALRDLDDAPAQAAAQAGEAGAHGRRLMTLAAALESLPARGEAAPLAEQARASRDALAALERSLVPR